MDPTRKLWAGLAVLLFASFAALLWVGSEIAALPARRPLTCIKDSHRGRA